MCSSFQVVFTELCKDQTLSERPDMKRQRIERGCTFFHTAVDYLIIYIPCDNEHVSCSAPTAAKSPKTVTPLGAGIWNCLADQGVTF